MQAALEELALGNVGCSIHACQAVRDLLREAGHLRSLHLYNNMSDDSGAQAIAQAGFVFEEASPPSTLHVRCKLHHLHQGFMPSCMCFDT